MSNSRPEEGNSVPKEKSSKRGKTGAFEKFLDPSKAMTQIHFRLDSELYERFTKVCGTEGIKLTTGLEIGMRMVIEHHEKELAKKSK